MKKCKQGYYYCYTDEVCKPIPKGLRVTARFSGGGKEPEETGIDVPTNGNGDGDGGDGGGGMSEGSLRKWFKGSKSKDEKPGWVNVLTGGTCASDEPGEGVPKCVSRSKYDSMTKAERKSAARRKKTADSGQQEKSGGAKPTYVSTDKPKKKMKKEEVEIIEGKDKKGKGSGTKDACYKKVKSRYSVWPSAYASGALVKCRKKGAANWGNKSESVEYSDWRDDFRATEYEFIDIIKPEPLISESPSFEIKKNDEVQGPEVSKEKQWNAGPASRRAKEGIDRLKKKLKKEEKENEEIEIEEKKDPCWDTHKQVGMKKKGGKMVPNCVRKEEKEESKIDGSNLKKLAAKAVRRVDADVDGDVDSDDMKSPETGEFVPSPDGKKLKPKVRFEQSDWRNELDEGWKSALAGAGVAAALMSQGGQKAPDKKTTSSSSTSNVERVSKTTQKTLSPMDKWRKNHPELAKKSDNPPKFNRKKLSPISKDWAKANPKLAEKEKDNRSKLGEGAAWTKKSGKNKKGGLNEKGRKSYEAENPGSDLKAPQPEGGDRKDSFCRRMKGMRKRQKPENNTGDDRLSLSLKKWKCG